ncbi:MAG: glycosyltransferase family 4 protein [Planctomycetota bacterium]
MINILFLIQDPYLPSSRYRVMQFLPRLEAEGIRCEAVPIPKGMMARRKLWETLGNYDVIFLQKRMFRRGVVRRIRKNARALIYDIDDAVMFNDSFKGHVRSRRREGRFAAMAGAADIVVVCNEYLARLARVYAKDVRVFPTVVDLSRYVPPRESASRSDKTTLGWIGSGSTIRYLEALRPALEEVGRRYKDAQLKLICDRFFDLENMPVIKAEWSEEAEIADLFGIDIGLAPAIDDPWFRGKSNLKVVQYLAARRAVVCAPVGAAREIVTDGETGLWARGPSEWIHRIGLLIEAPALRQRLGAAGRKVVEDTYSVDAVLPSFVKAIQDAAGRGKQS